MLERKEVEMDWEASAARWIMSVGWAGLLLFVLKSTVWAEFGHIKWYYKFKASSCLSGCIIDGSGNVEANREVYARVFEN
jgi:hypothetical protein